VDLLLSYRARSYHEDEEDDALNVGCVMPHAPIVLDSDRTMCQGCHLKDKHLGAPNLSGGV
jgi:hypothetical protein